MVLVFVTNKIGHLRLEIYDSNIKSKLYKKYEASRGAGAQSVTVIRLVVGSIPTREDEIIT